MIYKLTQEQLAHTLMPLGNYTKDEVRAIAEKAGIPCAHKEDSQEICFVTDGRYTDFIREHSDRPVPAEGEFVDEDGNVLGMHKGIYQYTVGQRKGLGIALGYPAYVTKILADQNQVVLGNLDALLSDTVILNSVNFMSIEDLKDGEKLSCFAKTRYHQPERPAYIERIDKDHIKIKAVEPFPGVSPGQSAVFYDSEGMVIGGGKIERSE
jgi:tRNA-specific 2-thiouridylase